MNVRQKWACVLRGLQAQSSVPTANEYEGEMATSALDRVNNLRETDDRDGKSGGSSEGTWNRMNIRAVRVWM